MSRIRLSASEKRMWEAAYAAAFTRLFYDELACRHSDQRSVPGAFDATMRANKAEEAETIADAAVAQLQRWRREGKATADMTRGAPSHVDTKWIRDEKAKG